MRDSHTPTTSRGASPGPPPAYSEIDSEISPSSSVSARIAQVLDQSTKRDSFAPEAVITETHYRDTSLDNVDPKANNTPRAPPSAYRDASHSRSNSGSTHSSFDKPDRDAERGDLELSGYESGWGGEGHVRCEPTKHEHSGLCCGGCCGLLGIVVALGIAIVSSGGLVI